VLVFYGGAIQGNSDRQARAHVHRALIAAIRDAGCSVVSEHASGSSCESTAALLETSIGPLPPAGLQRTRYVRRKMIEAVEGPIGAAIFEVSVPSLGTGIEIAHAYLRPRMGLSAIPVVALYEQGFWPNRLSSMIRGITAQDVPHFCVLEYASLQDAQALVKDCLGGLPGR